MASYDPEPWLSKFGLAAFRPGQRAVIEAILAGRDTLCIMPTGGGKSLCYQLPTMARPGVTIVISPLIALMKDQVDALNQIAIPATYINSSLSMGEQQARVDGMVKGEYKLIYVAPERLRSSAFLRAVFRTEIQLLAVDEAHCISHWGHDFRPDYARLGRFRARLGNPQTVALTATATAQVRADISKILELNQPATFVTGFARENLHISVISPSSNSDKDHLLIDYVNSTEGAGIIYASTRKNCEHLVELLQEESSRRLAFYHAGLTPDVRRKVQEDFMSGETEIIVATNAFGMGIDKSNLRFVLHYNMPGSVEAYYQEAGRAGRDGKPSKCLMLYSFQDKFIQEFFIENSYPSKETIQQIYDYLCSFETDPIEITLQDIKDELGLEIGTSGIGNCENLLETANAIERLDSLQNSAAIRIDSQLPTLVDLLPREARVQRKVLRGLERLCDSFREERVMFNPQRFAESLDLKWDAVSRAIRQLTKLPMIDYIPPFRGRAIHVIDRKRPFADLAIDFEELARRKTAEYEKLERMIRFATTPKCRQLEILEYFGDPERKACDNCDNCAANSKKRPNQTFDVLAAKPVLYVAQVVLSGIARTHGRVGKNLVAQMLTGSASKKLKQLGMDRLSTFGMLAQLRQHMVVLIIETLIELGFVQQLETTKFRPVVQLNAKGHDLMLGKIDFELQPYLPIEVISTLAIHYADKQPHRAGGQPLKQIDSDEQQIREMPTNLDPSTDCFNQSMDQQSDQLLMQTDVDTPLDHGTESHQGPDVKSLGQVLDRAETPRLENERILRSVKGSPIVKKPHLRADSSQSIDSSKEALSKIGTGGSLTASTNPKPSFYWTWRLLNEGYDLEEIIQIRGIERALVFEHGIQAITSGLELDPVRLLTAATIDRFQGFIDSTDTGKLSQMLVRLPPDFSKEQFAFFYHCLMATDAISES